MKITLTDVSLLANPKQDKTLCVQHTHTPQKLIKLPKISNKRNNLKKQPEGGKDILQRNKDKKTQEFS